MYNFIHLLITKEFIQPEMIVMTFPEINATTWAGQMCWIPSEHTTYVRLMYFNLDCVHVNIKRTNILNKCSKFETVFY